MGRMTSGSRTCAWATFSPRVLRVTVRWLSSSTPGLRVSSWRMALTPPARSTSSMWTFEAGETLQMLGTRAATSLRRASGYSTPPSWARARVWRTVLVEPPMAMSSAKALSIASGVTMSRVVRSASSRRIICRAACR